jgi:hypothetical protein
MPNLPFRISYQVLLDTLESQSGRSDVNRGQGNGILRDGK